MEGIDSPYYKGFNSCVFYGGPDWIPARSVLEEIVSPYFGVPVMLDPDGMKSDGRYEILKITK